MDSVALFVDFDGIYENLRKKSLPVSPVLLAQSLRRTARAFGSPLRAYACADWSRYTQTSESSAREAFEAEGFEVLSSSSRHETIWRMEERIFRLIYDDGTPPKTFILVTNDGQFSSAADRLLSLSYHVRLWAVGDDVPPQFTSSELTVTPLEELLDLRAKTMTPARMMALFIDLENVAISLNSLGFLVDPEILAKSFRAHAQKQGSLVEAYAYADWQKLPPAVDASGKNLMAEAQRTFELSSIETRYLITIAGKNSADMRMADDIRDLLEDRNPPDLFIIASGDRDFTPIIDTLVRDHKEVIVWGVEGCTSPSLSRSALVEYIQTFVPLLKRGQTLPATVGDLAQPGGLPGLQPYGQEDGLEARPTSWTKLVMVIDDLMKRNNWKWVSLSRATSELARLKEFGPTEEDARYTLNQAVARGIVLKERIQNPNPNYPDQFVWAFRPNEDSLVVRAVRLVPERVLDIMRYGLGRMEYVAFSYLQTQLARDRSLAQPWLNLDDEIRTQWINFLISEGLIHISRRPHHRNPTDLVTALTLPSNGGQALRPSGDVAARGVAKEGNPEDGAAEAGEQCLSASSMWKRLAVSIDNFTIRSGMDWAPLITLRQRLSTFGREDMEVALRKAQESGDIGVQEYPNPSKPYPTKGASLNRGSEAVREVLSQRDNIISALVAAHAAGRVISSQTVRDALPVEIMLADEQCSLWLSILVGERVISCAPIISGQPRTYQLNVEHPVVRQLTGSAEAFASGEFAMACESSVEQPERTLTSPQ